MAKLLSQKESGSSHSILGASAEDRRALCPGSAYLEQGRPNNGSIHAASGTVAHELATWCLTQNLTSPLGRLGDVVHVDGFAITVDVEMVEAVEQYVARTRALVEEGDTLLVEQRLDIGWLTSLTGDDSSADVVILKPRKRQLIVRDLKYGKGKRVDANTTLQPVKYGIAALAQFDMILGKDDVDEIIVEIDQPRIENGVTARRIPIAEIHAEETKLRHISERCHAAARSVNSVPKDEWIDTYLNPTEEGCHFCNASAVCPAAERKVLREVQMGFEEIEVLTTEQVKSAAIEVDADTVFRSLKSLELIEEWVASRRSEAYRLLENGVESKDWKLVIGRSGNRAWADEKKAEEVFKAMRFTQDEMYSFKLISPPQAEKMLKDSPRKWAKISPLIVKPEGKPVLAPASDKREQWKPVQQQFDEVKENAQEDNSDIL